MPTYYVSNGGADGANGLTPATSWQTISKVNGFTFQAGDTILLNRGDRWKETLTVPRNTLTIGAYGADPVLDADGYCTNAPILDGGAYVTSWSAYSGGAEVREIADDFTGVAGTNLTAHVPNVGTAWAKTTGDAFSNGNIVLSNANRARRNAINTKCKYAATPILGGDDYYVLGDIYVASTDTDFVEIIGRGFAYTDKGYWVRLSGASGGLAMGSRTGGTNTNAPAGAFTTVAGALGSYAATNTYRLRIEIEGSTIRGLIGPVAGPLVTFNTWTDTSIVEGDNAMLQLGAAVVVAADDTHGLHVDHFEQGPLGVVGSPVHTYQATTSPQVYVTVIDSNLSIKGANADQLEEGEFFWLANKLYIRRDAGLPGNTDVIRASLDFGIDVGTHSAITIDGVGFEYQEQQAVKSAAGASGLTIQNCMVQLGCNAEQGLNGCLAAWDINAVFHANHVRNVDSDGFYMNFGVISNPAPQITDNVIGPVSGFGADGCQIDIGDGITVNGYIARNQIHMTDPNTPKGCLILFGDAYTIEDNYFEGSGISIGTGAYGVALAGNTMVLRRNVFYNTGNDAIRSSANAPVTRSDHTYHHNLTVDCGMAIHAGLPGTNYLVYANTFVNFTRRPQFGGIDDYVVRFYDTITGEFKDNIVWDAFGAGLAFLLNNTSASFTRDYNLLGPEGTAFVSEAGVAYATLAAYVAARSQDFHSISADPQFRNPGVEPTSAATDYMIQPDSPAVGAGVAIPGIT